MNSTSVDLNNNTFVATPLSLRGFRLDGNGSGEWDQVVNASSSAWGSLTPAAHTLEAQSPDTAFILGGTELPSNNMLGGMMQYSMQSRTFFNMSAPCCNATGGILRGPCIIFRHSGPRASFWQWEGKIARTDRIVKLHASTSVLCPSLTPAKQAWWNQTTTGSPPSRRKEFCMAGVNSTDSTYEMYQDVCHPYIGRREVTLVLDSYTLAGMVLAAL